MLKPLPQTLMTEAIREKNLPQAPHEGGYVVEGGGTIRVAGALRKGKAATKYSFNGPIEDKMDDLFRGMGRVDLDELVIKWNFTAEKQCVKIAIAHVQDSSDIDDLCARAGNVIIYSNNLSMGKQEEFNVVVPGMYSRQVQPASSQLPRFKLRLEATDGVEIRYHAIFRYYGPIVQSRSLDCA